MKAKGLLGLCIRAATALVIGAGLTLRPGDVPPGRARGSRASGEVMIARVNGDPLTRGALERVRAVQRAHQPGLDDSQAYARALETLTRHRLLVQEAHRRGLDGTPEEVQAYRERMEAALRQAPELDRILERQRLAFGADGPDYERERQEAYREALLLERLFRAWAEAWEPPSVQATEAYQAGGAGENVLILIPLPYAERSAARAEYARLRALAEARTPAALPAAFDRLARELRELPPGSMVHQVYVYERPSELPDFARHARGVREGWLGLYPRGDGSAVVYLVLKQESEPRARRLAAGRSALANEAWTRWVADQERRLWAQARIEVFPDRLPPAARPGVVDLFGER